MFQPRSDQFETDLQPLPAVPFPFPNAAIDIDFINRQYWWNSAQRVESEFTTFVLNGATFGPKGLTLVDTVDISLALGGLGTFIPGAVALAAVNNGSPSVNRAWFELNDNTTNERILFLQTTAPAWTSNILDGGVSQGTFSFGAGTLNIKHAAAISYGTNDIKGAANGLPMTPDVSATMPAVTTLRIGRSSVAGAPNGTISRLIVFTTTKSQDELNTITSWLRAPTEYRLSAFPFVDAALGIDMDFINRRYYWGGKTRREAEFTTFLLNGSTFDQFGLTPSTTIDVTLALAGLGTFLPGTFAVCFYQSGLPISGKAWFSVDDGTVNERFTLTQGTTGITRPVVTDGGVNQLAGLDWTATMINGAPYGGAMSMNTDDFKSAVNGVAAPADTGGTLPTVTTLRVGKSAAASSNCLGSIARLLLLTATKTQAEVNALSLAMQGVR